MSETTQNSPATDVADEGRRNLLKMAGVSAAALTAVSFGAPLRAQTAEWDKTFPQSDAVEHSKVEFTNRYGITLVGDLYMPAERPEGPMPALAIAGPFGAVKEQAAQACASGAAIVLQ